MILLALSTIAAVTASGADAPPRLELTSFNYTNPTYSRTAELCGRINGKFSANTRVDVTVDPGNDAGTYVTWPGAKGRFCVLINSLAGRVEASLWDGTAKMGAAASIDAGNR